jgi:hypothetical protein
MGLSAQQETFLLAYSSQARYNTYYPQAKGIDETDVTFQARHTPQSHSQVRDVCKDSKMLDAMQDTPGYTKYDT